MNFLKGIFCAISWCAALFIFIFSIVEFSISGGLTAGVIFFLLFLFLVPPIRKKVIIENLNGYYKAFFTPIVAIVLYFAGIFVAPRLNIAEQNTLGTSNIETSKEENISSKEEFIDESEEKLFSEVSEVSKEIEPSSNGESIDELGEKFFSAEEVSGTLEEVDTGIIGELQAAGYTVEQASEIQQILNTIGIYSIKIESMTGKAQEGLNSVVCYPNDFLEDRDRRCYFTTEDGVLFYVGFRDEDLYDIDKGGFLKSYSDVHVPETEVTMEEYDTLVLAAETEVKSLLTYPTTANFSLIDWGVGRSDEHYKIIGKVTAKNGLGIEDEILFSVWFVKDNSENFVVEGMTFDNIRVK